MDNNRTEAYNIMKKAEKEYKGSFFGNLFSGKESRADAAIEKLNEAAIMLKLCKDFEGAGQCYERIAQIQSEVGIMSADPYEEAAHSYSFVNQDKAMEITNKAMKIYEKQGRFQNAAKIQKKMAEGFEADGKHTLAIISYKRASDYFTMESGNYKSYEFECLRKAADLMCTTDHKDAFKEGIKIYEKIAMYYLTVNLLKSQAKDLFFKIVVLYLAYDSDNAAENQLNKFIHEDPTMTDTREHTFLKDSIESIREGSVENFLAAKNNYSKFSNFDKWKTIMFDKICERIEGTGNSASNPNAESSLPDFT